MESWFLLECPWLSFHSTMGFPGSASGEEPTCNAGDARDLALIPGLGGSPGGEHGNPLQYSCRENPMDRGAWWATVHGFAKSQTRLTHALTMNFLLDSWDLGMNGLPWFLLRWYLWTVLRKAIFTSVWNGNKYFHVCSFYWSNEETYLLLRPGHGIHHHIPTGL